MRCGDDDVANRRRATCSSNVLGYHQSEHEWAALLRFSLCSADQHKIWDFRTIYQTTTMWRSPIPRRCTKMRDMDHQCMKLSRIWEEKFRWQRSLKEQKVQGVSLSRVISSTLYQNDDCQVLPRIRHRRLPHSAGAFREMQPLPFPTKVNDLKLKFWLDFTSSSYLTSVLTAFIGFVERLIVFLLYNVQSYGLGETRTEAFQGC